MPVFVFTLDLELGIGLDHSKYHQKDNPLVGRNAFSCLLDLTKKYNIPLTVACCGHLLLDKCKGHDDISKPKNISFYQGDWYKNDPCSYFPKNKTWYAPDLIKRIIKDGHEIACHTFSHVPFNQCSKEVAEAEIQESIKAAKRFDLEFKTFVFPKNSVAHLKLLKKYNFKYFVSGQTEQKISKPSFPPPRFSKGLIEVPRTYYFRHYSLKEKLKLKRLLVLAEKRDKFFHLWTHEWCLTTNKHFQLLEKIFIFLRKSNFEIKRIQDINI